MMLRWEAPHNDIRAEDRLLRSTSGRVALASPPDDAPARARGVDLLEDERDGPRARGRRPRPGLPGLRPAAADGRGGRRGDARRPEPVRAERRPARAQGGRGSPRPAVLRAG